MEVAVSLMHSYVRSICDSLLQMPIPTSNQGHSDRLLVVACIVNMHCHHLLKVHTHAGSSQLFYSHNLSPFVLHYIQPRSWGRTSFIPRSSCPAPPPQRRGLVHVCIISVVEEFRERGLGTRLGMNLGT